MKIHELINKRYQITNLNLYLEKGNISKLKPKLCRRNDNNNNDNDQRSDK